MSITLKQMASVCIERCSGGDRQNKSELTYPDVIFKIRGILNEILKPSYFEKWNEGDRSAITQCLVSYELILTNDVDCAYVTLPDFYVSLPFNRGVHRIYQRALKAAGNPTGTEFTISHQPSINLKARAARYSGVNVCWIEGFKVKFYNLYAEPTINANVPGTNKVIVQLIVAAPDSIGENDPLPIMPEAIDKVYDRFMAMELQPPLRIETPQVK